MQRIQGRISATTELIAVLEGDCECFNKEPGDEPDPWCVACEQRARLIDLRDDMKTVEEAVAKSDNLRRRWVPVRRNDPYLCVGGEVRITLPGHKWTKRRAIVNSVMEADDGTVRVSVRVLPWRSRLVLLEHEVLPTGRKEVWMFKPQNP